MIQRLSRCSLSRLSVSFSKRCIGTRSVSRRCASSLLSASVVPLEVHPEVEEALNRRRPVIALETAIVTHGLPYPTSVSLPLELERIVREQGAVPAHIGIVDGKVKIGLHKPDLEMLADPRATAERRWKVGRREIAGALIARANGGTTVSGTMFLARLAGIKVFVTGGIGGVHRGAQTTMDISSDLTELAKTPVAVICAGAKSILDIGLTLEYLETQGVPVCAYGHTKDFPAFYTPRSGFYAPMNFETPRECASLINMHWRVDDRSGLLFGVPIPASEALKGDRIQRAVEQAVCESEEQGMSRRGKEVTPWLLARVKELTQGVSVDANIALIRNNALVGSQIAAELAKLQGALGANEDAICPVDSHTRFSASATGKSTDSERPTSTRNPSASILVIGSAAVDVTSRQGSKQAIQSATTVPGTITIAMGGVARNIAEAAYRLGAEDVALLSPLGKDEWATMLRRMMEDIGLRTDALLEKDGKTTSVCSLVHDHSGELMHGVADMGIVEDLTGEEIQKALDYRSPRVVCLDGNLSARTLEAALDLCRQKGIQTVFEPTSNPKALRILPAFGSLFVGAHESVRPAPALSLMVPNLLELESLLHSMRSSDERFIDTFNSLDWFQEIDELNLDPSFRATVERQLPGWVTQRGAMQMAVQLLPAVGMLMVKNGGGGILVVSRAPRSKASVWRDARGWIVSKGGLIAKHFPPSMELRDGNGSITNVNGAGDTVCGAVLAGLASGLRLDRPDNIEALVDVAQGAAIRTLQSPAAVGDIADLRHRFPKISS